MGETGHGRRMLRVGGKARPADGHAALSANRPFRKRESRAIIAGWTTAACAWIAFSLLPDSAADLATAAALDPVPSFGGSMSSGAGLSPTSIVQEFHRALDRDRSLTGDRAVQGLAGWRSTTAQLELLASDGSRRITIADDLPESDWLQRASEYRHGAEALVVSSRQVPRQLERAADACVASGDLLRFNGRETEAASRFARAVQIYDGILAQLGSEAGEFAGRIQRKRSIASIQAAKLEAGDPSTLQGQKRD